VTDDLPAFPMARQCPFDPPADLVELAASRPIGRVRIWDGSTPWLITRHDDVRAVLADRRFSSDPTKSGFPNQRPVSKFRRARSRGSFLTMDDPEHARYRRMLVGEFTVRRIAALRPRIEQTVHALLDEMAAGPNPVDLVAAFALPCRTPITSSSSGRAGRCPTPPAIRRRRCARARNSPATSTN
jgi:hypothetical protein